MRKIKGLLLLALLTSLVGCSNSSIKEDNINYTEKDKEGKKEELIINKEESIDKMQMKVESMSLEQKIGQMIISGFDGTYYNEEINYLINDCKVGGIILFGRNIVSSEELIELTQSIRDNNEGIPVFISTDEEGGRVSRLPDDMKKFPDAMSIGDSNDESLAYDNAKEIGELLLNTGINLDFAPVLDIYSNYNNTVIGDRAFGRDEAIVSKMGIAAMRGLEDSGVVPTVKHFPGHGDTDVDSHYGLPIVYKTLEELNNFEFIPFKEAIENNCDAIMVSHIILNEVDSENPATLSKKVIDEILRKDLGFNNIVITDDMAMGAITNTMTITEASIKSIEAGSDIILLGNGLDYVKDITAGIKTKVENNEISEERINESVYRILKVKEKYAIMEGDYE